MSSRNYSKLLCGSSGSAILSHCGRGESCGLMRALLHTLNTLEQLLRVQACPSCQTSMASPQRVPWPLMPAWVQHTPCRSCQVFLFSTPHMQQSIRGFFAPFQVFAEGITVCQSFKYFISWQLAVLTTSLLFACVLCPLHKQCCAYPMSQSELVVRLLHCWVSSIAGSCNGWLVSADPSCISLSLHLLMQLSRPTVTHQCEIFEKC